MWFWTGERHFVFGQMVQGWSWIFSLPERHGEANDYLSVEWSHCECKLELALISSVGLRVFSHSQLNKYGLQLRQVNRSSESRVSLEPVTLLSRGTYRCEVSADAPSFQTVYEDRCMDVLGRPIRTSNYCCTNFSKTFHVLVSILLVFTVPPRKGPEISGVYPWYNIGDNFTAKCVVEKTYPEPKISWFVNDVQVKPEKFFG